VSDSERRSPRSRKRAHPEGSPADATEALLRARDHARAAARESVATLQALLDAASLATTGVPAGARPELSLVTRALDELVEGLGRPRAEGSRLLEAVAEALDAEIARWEARAADDTEARAVLRAWLGLRELLWELGVRRSRRGAGATRARSDRHEGAPRTGAARPAARPARRTLQRVTLEG
jgi:hypothetical protein